MALDKTGLRSVLDNQPVTKDERDMWLHVGFYVTYSAVDYNARERVYKHFYVSNKGERWHIPDFVAKSIRSSVIDWWDQEKKITFSPMDTIEELENRRE